MFNPQMLGQLKFYLECLDDDSVMPKQKLLKRVDKELEKQSRIAEIQAQGQQLIAQQQQFYNMDPDSQATTMMKQKLINQIKEDYASRQGKIKQTEEDLNEENNQEENA